MIKSFNIRNYLPLALQICRFGIVGLSAAATHFTVVILLVQNQIAVPLVANVAGFLCGFQISYWGHRNWTFRNSQTPHSAAASRLLVVQLLNFMANESLYYLFLSFELPYTVALLIVLTVLPFFTFIASKMWVFE